MTYTGGVLAGMVLFIHALTFIVAPFFATVSWSIWLTALTIKVLLDVVLIKTGEHPYGIRMNPLKLTLIALAYIPYLPLVALASIFWRPDWKGRRT